MFKKIKYKIKQVFIHTLIKISLFFNCPRLTAMALWLAAGRINPLSKSQHTVLCLGRSIFIDDVKAMAAYSGQIKYVVIWRSYFQMIFGYFVNGRERDKLTEANYHTHDYCRQGKEKYYLFLKKVFPVLRKLLGFDAAFSGNFTYREQQEFARVSEENKVPFCVLFKEGFGATVSETFAKWFDLLRGCKFVGARIMFYGDRIAAALLSVGLAGLTKDKIKIAGLPRLDYYFVKNDVPAVPGKQIVLFSFSILNFSHLINEADKLEQARKKCDYFHLLIMRFAEKHPDFKVIIKTKAAEHYLNYAQKIFTDNFKDNGTKMDNLVITNSGDPMRLIKESTAVAGFYSTTLMEAIVAGKIILSPHFENIFASQDWDYFAKYPELINYVKTEASLEEHILNSDRYLNYGQEKKKEFLGELIRLPDGRASQQAEEIIIEAIKEYKTIQ